MSLKVRVQKFLHEAYTSECTVNVQSMQDRPRHVYEEFKVIHPLVNVVNMYVISLD